MEKFFSKKVGRALDFAQAAQRNNEAPPPEALGFGRTQPLKL